MACNWLKFACKKISVSFDMFKAPACLRARGQPQVSRLCPGVLSLLLAILFLYVLISGIVKLARYQEIDSSLIYQTQLNISLPSFENISVSISPAWLDYKNWTRMFKIQSYLQIYTDVVNQSPLQMQKCTLQKWNQYSQIFLGYDMQQNTCIKNPEQVKLQGTNTYRNITFLKLYIKRCQQMTQNDTSCMNQTEFNSKLQQMYKQKQNYFSVYLIDTRINQFKDDPVETFIPMTFNYFYNNISRYTLQIYLGLYVVETDYTVMPLVENIKTVQGYYISEITSSKKDKQVQKQIGRDYYGVVNIYMSTDRIKYVRNIGKIDTVISYAGGLFGLILAFFAIFVYSYNKFSYELLVAEHSFNYYDSGAKVRMKNFNFIKYVKFQIYQWLSFVKFLKPNWKDCQMIYQTKDQANLYLDVQYLFRKMRMIDLALKRLVPEQEQKILNLTQPPCLKQVQQKRNCLQYYNKIIEGEDAQNIEDLKKQIQMDIQNIRLTLGKGASHIQQGPQMINGSQNMKISKQKQYQQHNVIEYGRTSSLDYMLSSDQIPQGQNNLPELAQIRKTTSKKQLNNEFINKIRQNLKIQNELLLEKLNNYKQLYDKASQMEEDQEIQEVQTQFANAYLKISRQSRQVILNKIPLKILFRICQRIEKMKNETVNDNKQNKQNNGQQPKKGQ